jgi:oxygen-independent coproporphyrinogen-3 oxidase
LEGVRRAAEAHRSLPAYAAAVGAAGVGWRSCEALDARAEDEELVLMGLRLAEGVDLARLQRLLDALPIAPLAQMGLVVAEQHRLRLTPAGRLVADRVAMELLGGADR